MTKRPETRTRKQTGTRRAGPEPLERPNVAAPLTEPTRHRRVWAAYLAAGYTRREFAERLGTNYHTVNRWDAGAAAMSLDMLARAARLLGYSMDELCFGAAAAASTSPAPAAPLTQQEIRQAMDAIAASPGTRAAFGEHLESPAGRYQTPTLAYVHAWCSAFERTLDPAAALQAAVNARAVTEAVAADVAPVSDAQLRATLRRRERTR